MRRPAAAGALLACLAVAGQAACGRQAATPPELPTDLTALERERDQWREKLAQVRERDRRLAQAPQADILVGLPAPFTAGLVQEVTRGFLAQVEVILRDLRVKKDDDVRVKAKIATLKAGHFSLDLLLHEAHATLKPGTPKVDFAGQRLRIELPVTLAEGRGRATADFAWDSQGLGAVVCEDFAVKLPVAGRVAPHSVNVRGSFLLRVEGGSLVAEPKFDDFHVLLQVEPSAETWKQIDQVVAERSWKCEKVLNAVDVRRVLAGLLAKGFRVRIPARVVRPVRLPASFDRALRVEGKSYALNVHPLALELAADTLWFGAALGVDAGQAPPGAAPGSGAGTPSAARTPARPSAPAHER